MKSKGHKLNLNGLWTYVFVCRSCCKWFVVKGQLLVFIINKQCKSVAVSVDEVIFNPEPSLSVLKGSFSSTENLSRAEFI